jgi:polar amino acid transport system permease protein
LGLALAFAAILLGRLLALCAFATMAGAAVIASCRHLCFSDPQHASAVLFVSPCRNSASGWASTSFIFAGGHGAHLTEVFRAGLAGVPKGVMDAGRAIGLTGFQLALYVISPIMWRNCLPALGTTFISLFKDTSLAAVIAIPELTYQARKLNTETFRVAEAWATASVLYLATCLLIAAGLRQLERRFPKF